MTVQVLGVPATNMGNQDWPQPWLLRVLEGVNQYIEDLALSVTLAFI